MQTGNSLDQSKFASNTTQLVNLSKMASETNTQHSSTAGCPLHGISKVQIDMISGICAGILATLVAHPLDTVKVRF